MVPYTVVRSPPSIAATFRPSGLLQVGRSAVLHRLMDREALMLLFDGSESYLSLLDDLGLR